MRKAGVKVTVLTAMPNYPGNEIHEAYKGKKYYYEEMDGIEVHRSSIYVSPSRSIINRLRNYFSFVWSSYLIGRRKLRGSYDFVICESPPLFLGMSSVFLAKKLKAKFIFNVSDLWPESAEKLGIVTNPFFLRMSTWLEEWLYKKARMITGQTQGIVKNISGRFPQKKVHWLPNGVDLEMYQPAPENKEWKLKHGFAEKDQLYIYAGVLGHAQGLEVILKAAELLRDENGIQFLLFGKGPEEKSLKALKEKKSLDNVHFMGLVSKSEMPEILAASSYSIVPLKKLDLFKGAIPSKIFEVLAMERPIILGVEGEAQDLFIKEGQCGLFFEPENHRALADCIARTKKEPPLQEELGRRGREYVKAKFNREVIAEELLQQLKKIYEEDSNGNRSQATIR